MKKFLILIGSLFFGFYGIGLLGLCLLNLLGILDKYNVANIIVSFILGSVFTFIAVKLISLITSIDVKSSKKSHGDIDKTTLATDINVNHKVNLSKELISNNIMSNSIPPTDETLLTFNCTSQSSFQHSSLNVTKQLDVPYVKNVISNDSNSTKKASNCIDLIKLDDLAIKIDETEVTRIDLEQLRELDYQAAIERDLASNNPKFKRTNQEKELSFQFTYKSPSYKKVENLMIKFEEHYSIIADMPEICTKSEFKAYIQKVDNVLNFFYKAKDISYNTKGGMIYFQDMYEYCHNSSNECFSIAEDLIDLREKLDKILYDNFNEVEDNAIIEIFSIDNSIYILDKYLNSINTAKNLNTVLAKFVLAEKHIKFLEKNNIVHPITEENLLNDAATRCYEEMLTKLASLKTQKAKINNINRFYDAIISHSDFLPKIVISKVEDERNKSLEAFK